MWCPVCREVQLVMSERQGIEIDYCPQCRGVWLDRGELDKIIERSAQAMEPPNFQAGPSHRDYDEGYDRRGKKKRRGFLDDLFDFD